MSDPSCLFCKMVAGDVPAEVVHDAERVLAFRDIRPEAPSHILLIPKEHVRDLTAVTDEHAAMLADVVRTATHLAEAEKLDGGWRLVANVGPDAGQSVFHLHFHLLGGRKMAWPPG